MTALPPLAAVRVFESVARHGNFSRAAAELNMTQSAVSYQIKLLESFVGAPLFVRQARGVALSEKGKTVAPTVRRALGDLAQSFRLAREDSNSVLVISTMQTIAGNWLAPRLGGFQLLHPEYTVRLDISPNMVDLESEGVDVVIRSGKGIWLFKLYRTRRGFLVRDVNVSSVWLAQQLRSTFVGVIRRNGGDINALFKYLRT